jgi:hypothetical protein
MATQTLRLQSILIATPCCIKEELPRFCAFWLIPAAPLNELETKLSPDQLGIPRLSRPPTPAPVTLPLSDAVLTEDEESALPLIDAAEPLSALDARELLLSL